MGGKNRNGSSGVLMAAIWCAPDQPYPVAVPLFPFALHRRIGPRPAFSRVDATVKSGGEKPSLLFEPEPDAQIGPGDNTRKTRKNRDQPLSSPINRSIAPKILKLQ